MTSQHGEQSVNNIPSDSLLFPNYQFTVPSEKIIGNEQLNLISNNPESIIQAQPINYVPMQADERSPIIQSAHQHPLKMTPNYYLPNNHFPLNYPSIPSNNAFSVPSCGPHTTSKFSTSQSQINLPPYANSDITFFSYPSNRHPFPWPNNSHPYYYSPNGNITPYQSFYPPPYLVHPFNHVIGGGGSGVGQIPFYPVPNSNYIERPDQYQHFLRTGENTEEMAKNLADISTTCNSEFGNNLEKNRQLMDHYNYFPKPVDFGGYYSGNSLAHPTANVVTSSAPYMPEMHMNGRHVPNCLHSSGWGTVPMTPVIHNPQSYSSSRDPLPTTFSLMSRKDSLDSVDNACSSHTQQEFGRPKHIIRENLHEELNKQVYRSNALLSGSINDQSMPSIAHNIPLSLPQSVQPEDVPPTRIGRFQVNSVKNDAQNITSSSTTTKSPVEQSNHATVDIKNANEFLNQQSLNSQAQNKQCQQSLNTTSGIIPSSSTAVTTGCIASNSFNQATNSSTSLQIGAKPQQVSRFRKARIEECWESWESNGFVVKDWRSKNPDSKLTKLARKSIPDEVLSDLSNCRLCSPQQISSGSIIETNLLHKMLTLDCSEKCLKHSNLLPNSKTSNLPQILYWSDGERVNYNQLVRSCNDNSSNYCKDISRLRVRSNSNFQMIDNCSPHTALGSKPSSSKYPMSQFQQSSIYRTPYPNGDFDSNVGQYQLSAYNISYNISMHTPDSSTMTWPSNYHKSCHRDSINQDEDPQLGRYPPPSTPNKSHCMDKINKELVINCFPSNPLYNHSQEPCDCYQAQSGLISGENNKNIIDARLLCFQSLNEINNLKNRIGHITTGYVDQLTTEIEKELLKFTHRENHLLDLIDSLKGQLSEENWKDLVDRRNRITFSGYYPSMPNVQSGSNWSGNWNSGVVPTSSALHGISTVSASTTNSKPISADQLTTKQFED